MQGGPDAVWLEGDVAGGGRWCEDEPSRGHILRNLGSCTDDAAVADEDGADDLRLTAYKDGGLAQKNAIWDVAKTGGELIALRGEVVECGAGTDFGVIFSRGAACHEGVAKVDERSCDNLRQENGLFEADGMPDVNAFFEEASFSNFGAISDADAIQEGTVPGASLHEGHVGTQLGILDVRAAALSDFAVGPDIGLLSLQAGAGVEDGAGGNVFGVDVFENDSVGCRDDDAAIEAALDGERVIVHEVYTFVSRWS